MGEQIQNLLLIAVGSAFVNNVVLSQFLGICPFLGVSKNVKTAAGMGSAVVFVITIASFVTGLIYKFILGNPNIMGRRAGLSEYDRVHPRDRGAGTVCGDGAEEIHACALQCAWSVPSPDHDELRGARVALTNVQEGYDILTGVVNGFCHSGGIPRIYRTDGGDP